ncbi:MAG: radical SAM protein [Chloroflexi bacterium]|nr:radical SAM protein [Chloroflexota bacterium]
MPAPAGGLATGRRGFAAEMHFYAPGLKRYETEEFVPQNLQRFVPISLTGTRCALQCDHCEGKLLESMRAVEHPDRLWELCVRLAGQGTKGVLISGGCDSQGKVPLLGFARTLARVKRELGLTLLVHTGLLDEESAAALARIGVDGAMLDIVGAAQTIRSVYHLKADAHSYERSLELLTDQGIPTMPHVVLGLQFGQILGEDAALDMVAHHPVAALVLVVIAPLAGTAMSDVAPPDLTEVERLFRKARALLPETPVILGCARPMGPLRPKIDRLAVDCGLNGIAYPAEGTVEYARSRGLAPRFYEECCALIHSHISRSDI